MPEDLGVKGSGVAGSPGNGSSEKTTASGGNNLHRLHVARAMEQETKPDFLDLKFSEIEVTFDPVKKAVWCWSRPIGPPSITRTMVREFLTLHRAVHSYVIRHRGPEAPVRYFVQGSRLPGIYNMGGDLAFFAECVRHGEREKLRRYAHDCVESVHGLSVGFDCGVVSIGLLQGDALGGGFEGALCCHTLIAERQAKLGLPEILFNSFPGMGAYSFLSRRLGTAMAEKMILSGRVYSAEEMRDLGIVEDVVDEGCGEAAVQRFLSDSDRGYSTREALYRVRQRVSPLPIQELRDVTDIWVDAMMRLSHADLRRMELLQAAQVRRLAKHQDVDLAHAAE